MKYCQAPLCHTYDTQDRKRGTKGNKRNQTRRRTSLYYLGGNACSMQCERDWFDTYGTRALDYFGRITEPKKLEEHNAWRKRRHWSWNDQPDTYYSYNLATGEERPMSEEQFNDSSYTLNI